MLKKLITLFLLLYSFPVLSDSCGTPQQCLDTAIQIVRENEKKITRIEQSGMTAVPKGAVIAFDLDECPDGWDKFYPVIGRFILGAGSGPNLTKRHYGDNGGAEKVLLTKDNLPAHNHNNGAYNRLLTKNSRTVGVGSDTRDSPHPGGEPDVYSNKHILSVGGDKPHENMPPFYVLNYCKKL